MLRSTEVPALTALLLASLRVTVAVTLVETVADVAESVSVEYGAAGAPGVKTRLAPDVVMTGEIRFKVFVSALVEVIKQLYSPFPISEQGRPETPVFGDTV